MAKSLREIAEDSLLKAFASTIGKRRGKGLVVKHRNDVTSFRHHRYECIFEAQVTDEDVSYFLYPRRVGVADTWFGAMYADFEQIPVSEHGRFSNTMKADFRALFTSILETPYAWEGMDAKQENVACFLTDIYWLNRSQCAPVALNYPEQTMNAGEHPLASLIPLQEGYNHCCWYEPAPEAASVSFRAVSPQLNIFDASALWLMDDVTIRNEERG